jgi:hypothetical protein
MALDVFGTEFLLGAYGVIDTPRQFLLELFFPAIQEFETEKVAFDKVERARRLAPFVSPNVAGKPRRQQGFQTKDFAPAYVKPKYVVDPGRPLKRMPGERLLGSMSPQQRYLRVIAELLGQEDMEISRREEWMAAQIMLNGSVVVQGDDYPPVTVDFGRPSGQTLVLSGGSRWGQSGISPMSNLRSWNTTVMQASGFNASVVVMDPSAEELFIKDPEVKEILDNRVNTPVGDNFKIGNLQIAGVLAGAIGEEVKYLGRIGEFEIFVYQHIYTNEDGTTSPMLPANTVLLGSPKGVQGTRLYGAIRDADATFRALARFPKMWREKDPSNTLLMTQSAPLPVLGWPEASMAVTVN